MLNRVFVYGILQDIYSYLWHQYGRIKIVDIMEGNTPGDLFDLGYYPVSFYDPESINAINGALVIVEDPIRCLRSLDFVEGVRNFETGKGGFLYDRIVAKVQTEKLGEVDAWMYVGNTIAKRKIKKGKYPHLNKGGKTVNWINWRGAKK